MESLRGDIYDYPKYYDLVYGSDWREEYDFLCGSFLKYAAGRVQRVFEPACGTGRLLYRLGKAGYQVSGLDLNPRAVTYCNQRLERHQLPPAVWVGDMTEFQLRPHVDAGFNMINSFRHLQDDASAAGHLECMAQSLRKGGIYVLGLHLTPTRGTPMDEESWSARRGNLAVNTRLWTTARDAKKRVETCAVTYDVYTPTQHTRIADELTFRTYTWPQFEALLARIPAFEIAAVHDFSYNLATTVPIRAETEDVVFVFRRR